MVEKVNIELDEPFLKKFFALTDRMIPDDQEITLAMLRKQVDEIALNIEELKVTISSQKPGYTPANREPTRAVASFGDTYRDSDGFNLPKRTILIIDDLGVITYQLAVLFKQYNYEVITSKEIYDAIDKFKKQSFDLVIMDLFIPTEREGFILLEELKKIAMTKQKPTKIGVMSASGKKEHKQLCKMKGAEFFVEKIDDWQKELYGIINSLK